MIETMTVHRPCVCRVSNAATSAVMAAGSRARWRWWLMAWLPGLAAVLTACATGPKLVNHAFGFNARIDSPGHEVLAYRYGDGKGVARSSDTAIRQFGRSKQGDGINGPMPLGDTLYVKWRDLAADQTYEDTVDLRPLLPRDMTRQEIYFMVAGPQLYVYLIDPVLRPADWPVVGPKKFQNEKIRQIYPR